MLPALFLPDIKKMRICDLFAMQIRIFNIDNLMNTREIILGIRVSTLFDRDKACENLGYFFLQIRSRGLKETRPKERQKAPLMNLHNLGFLLYLLYPATKCERQKEKDNGGRVRFCTFWVWNLIKWYWRLRFVCCTAFFFT